MFTKAIEAPSGEVTTYWHRRRAELTDEGLVVELDGYLSMDAKLAGKRKMDGRSFFVGADVLYGGDLPVPDLTPIIRAILRYVSPEFADAQDALAVAAPADPPPEAPT